MEKKDLFDLTGRVALITGASSGLGVQYAHGLANQGAKLAIAARRLDRLEAIAKEFESDGVECLPIKCDVTKEDEIIAMIEKTVEHYGKIDILVNNAGIATSKFVHETTTDDWNRILSVNLTSAFIASREVFKYMKEQNYGRIINTCSMQAIRTCMVQSGAPYSASKAGEVMLVKSLASEWASYGITVNGIGPGFFLTDIDREYCSSEAFKQELKANCPMGRIGAEGELNGALIYLASECSSYTTGQIIYIDGGWTLV